LLREKPFAVPFAIGGGQVIPEISPIDRLRHRPAFGWFSFRRLWV
jgi:hypothetical protein